MLNVVIKLFFIFCFIDWLLILIIARKGMLQQIFQLYKIPDTQNPFQESSFEYEYVDEAVLLVIVPILFQALVATIVIFFSSVLTALITLLFFIAFFVFLLFNLKYKHLLLFDIKNERELNINNIKKVVTTFDYYVAFNIVYFMVIAYFF